MDVLEYITQNYVVEQFITLLVKFMKSIVGMHKNLLKKKDYIKEAMFES
jgi:hypothetical protein